MDNFDLKKFLKENKAFENLNPTIKSLNENESREERADVDKYEYEKGKQAGKREKMKAKIKEMIIAELAEETVTDMMDPVYEADDSEEAIEDTYDIDIEEAKKKKDEEEVEDVEDVEATDTEEMPADDAEMPAEEAPAAGGGLEDIAADMEGTEGELMDSLMKALKIAKGMGNEKLETQVGNTLKFFVSEYIGGDEN
jgi:hypothetical protein